MPPDLAKCLDYRNLNTLWAAVAVETLARLGLTTAIICPGSRSTPLTVALAQHPQIEAIPILDERSAAFFALGCAKRLGLPTALVCTSGTAGANFYPAVIEASESNVPLLLLTADRPPELRDCASGQTIDQQKLFGHFPRWYAELALPATAQLAYLRQTVIQAWTRSRWPQPGPVHLNCPFRDPLPPLSDPTLPLPHLDEAAFFAAVRPPTLPQPQSELPWDVWQACDRGLIIAGPTEVTNPERYCQAVSQLAKHLGWPVLAEGLSPLRNHQSLNPHLITTYDILLRHPPAALQPDCVLQLGPLPTSKPLRQWLAAIQPRRWILHPYATNLDPLHGPAQHLPAAVAPPRTPPGPPRGSAFLQTWLHRDRTLRHRLNACLTGITHRFEGKAAWLLSQHLPPQTPVFIANSMSVREVETFWQANDRRLQPYFSRGANGIDGTLSTALGIAHRSRPSVLLTGDLAFLHDTNGLLFTKQLVGHLTVVLINNSGGGIFEMLPIAQFEPPFEQYFAMPQAVDLAALCGAYGVEHVLIQDWSQFVGCVETLPQSSMRLLEVRCDRKQDARWRQQVLLDLAKAVSNR
ncbi:MAG: 2-succinyl-5-enolpyruvyl-6-hydroxy-3-cyclohexene-1-carboxylic-acid synthase [Leptolyngbya sp. SIO4C1]|nr:2-succinyl-5-enolpyruvyl-6-hydroxy-3-cyclohexene-1-carboxylic-acid synthase [Leptolyngbya sp. SIO4C1]